jgi:transglutaminase-like putative cysteine protease
MRLMIRHITTYSYTNPVAYGLQQLRLTPKSRLGQSVLTWSTLDRAAACASSTTTIIT